MLIVGGGPAGAAAAVYAARKGIRTGVAAERFGGQVNDTLGIENYISVSETDGPKFAAALEAHVKDYNVDIHNLQRAEALIPAEQPGGLIQVRLANGATLKGDTSRVALALARTRLMAARFPYYLLADSPAGRKKQRELASVEPSGRRGKTTDTKLWAAFVLSGVGK